VGLRKRKFLAAEHGPALDWMRRIKALLDPEGILNPGKGPA
jgi:D-lactate dehydrogenase (cytochrome)